MTAFIDAEDETDISLTVIKYCVRYIKRSKTLHESKTRADINLKNKHRLATKLANATHQSTAVLFCKLRVPVSVRAASLMFTV